MYYTKGQSKKQLTDVSYSDYNDYMGNSRGSAEMYILIAIIIIGAFFLVGGVTGGFKSSEYPEESKIYNTK